MSKNILGKDLEELTVKELEKVIIYLNKEYRYGSEIVSDDTYDEYVEKLKKLSPNSPVLQEIGAPVRQDLEKIDLPVHMGSMDKVKPDSKELERWLSKYEGPYFLSAKLDGLACLYSNGCLYTRGDGSVGQNVSYLIPYLNLPKIKNPQGGQIFVRGELIISTNTFNKKYKDSFPKARSVVSGTINSKKPDPKILKDIDFLAFEWLEKRKNGKLLKALSPSEQFSMLKDASFQVPRNKLVREKPTSQIFTKYLEDMKSRSGYEADGMIIADDTEYTKNTSGNPKYAVAFKVNSEGLRTTIREIIWEPSMYGILVPTIRFDTVVIDGDNVSYASAFNAKYVKENAIRIGTKIKVVKSGDVIPYISEVIGNEKKGQYSMPDKKLGDYEWNENMVELVLKNPMKNEKVLEKRFLHFFTSLQIKYINIGLVKKFIRAGFKLPSDIYYASVEELMEVEGVKIKSATKYFESIHEVMDKPIPLERLVKASLVLGPGFGEKKLYPLFVAIEIVSKTKTGYRYTVPTLEEIVEVEGFSQKSGTQFIQNFPLFKDFMRENSFLKIEFPNSGDDSEGPLSSYYILFTGVRDKKLSEKLASQGANIESNFTKKTNLLIVKDLTTNNKKVEKARKDKIEIVQIDNVESKLL
jgi:NAD-dependent DNA ligase